MQNLVLHNGFFGVAETGTFHKAETMNDWVLNSDSGIPTGWKSVYVDTGVNDVKVDEKQSDGWIYTLGGQRATDSYKGVVIKDGHKVVVP